MDAQEFIQSCINFSLIGSKYYPSPEFNQSEYSLHLKYERIH